MLIALFASLPLLLLAVTIVAQLTDSKRQAKNEALSYAGRLLLETVDKEVSRYLYAAQMLAVSPSLQAADVTGFRGEAERALRGLPRAVIRIADADGNVLLDSSVADGGLMAPASMDAVAYGRKAIAGGAPQVGYLSRSSRAEQSVAISVPIPGGRPDPRQLIVEIEPRLFAELLEAQHLPEGWDAAIADANGLLIARSLPGAWTGRSVSPSWRAVLGRDGLYDFETPEGASKVSSTYRSRITGWTMAVGQQRNVFLAPIVRTYEVAIVAGLVVVLISLTLVAWVARSITGPIRSLAAGAAALECGERITLKPSGIVEFDRAFAAFDQAARLVLAHQRALQESDERIKVAQDAAHAGIWEWRLADNRNVWTEPLFKLYGLRPGTFMPSFENWASSIHPDDRDQAIGAVEQAAAAQREFEIQWRVNQPPGAPERWLLSRGRPIFDAEGAVERYVGIVIDVTERKRMEEAVRRSDQRTGAIIEALPIGVALFDTAGKTIVANSVFKLLAPDRVPSRDLVRARLWEATDEAGNRLKVTNFPSSRALRGERVWPGQDFLYHGDAERGPFWMRVAAIPHRDASGAIVGAIAVVADIDHEKRGIEALRAREEEFRAFFENDAVGTVELDLNGYFLKTNAYLRSLTGHSAEDLIGLRPTDITHPDDRAANRAELEDFLTGRINTLSTRKRLLRKDGSGVVWVEINAGMVRDAKGAPVRTAGIVLDITERKNAEDSLRETEMRMLHASRLSEIGRMAAALAHEVNQPLAAVANYMAGGKRMLDSGAMTGARLDKFKDMMAKANAQALRAGEVIRRLREFVGVGDSEKTIEQAAQVLQDAAVLATIAAKHNGVTVLTDFEGDAKVLVDKVQIQQVVLNLVRNAIEAMETSADKQLILTLQESDGHVRFSVSDTGAGVAPDIAARLFSPFASTKAAGMGIGLSVCREIIEAHGGKIDAEPRSGGGMVFSFTLPLLAHEERDAAE